MLNFFRKLNEESTEIDYTTFAMFLEEIKADYQNASPQLHAALDKFAERYRSAKSKSFPRLVSFLYDLNHNLNLTAHIKSGSKIRVQVESIKRRKMENSDGRRKLPATVCEGKENFDPQIIPVRKKKKTGKKNHNLNMHIFKNQPN